MFLITFRKNWLKYITDNKANCTCITKNQLRNCKSSKTGKISHAAWRKPQLRTQAACYIQEHNLHSLRQLMRCHSESFVLCKGIPMDKLDYSNTCPSLVWTAFYVGDESLFDWIQTGTLLLKKRLANGKEFNAQEKQQAQQMRVSYFLTTKNGSLFS